MQFKLIVYNISFICFSHIVSIRRILVAHIWLSFQHDLLLAIEKTMCPECCFKCMKYRWLDFRIDFTRIEILAMYLIW